MQFYRYWAKGEAIAPLRAGSDVPVACWEGSDVSESDARQRASTKAAQFAERLVHEGGFPDQYPYGVRVLREEILREFRDATGQLAAVVTRNRYGAEVLNAARVLFVDVDLPEGTGETLMQRLVRWWRRQPRQHPLDAALSRLTAWLETRSEWGVRIYRTAGGLRYLVTHALFTPGSPEAEAMMTAVGCDPQYVRLCRAQQTFRARLTPKPWRCGVAAPPDLRPPLDESLRLRAETWQSQYSAACYRFATCSLGGSYGNPRIAPEIQPILALHDDATRATSPSGRAARWTRSAECCPRCPREHVGESPG